MTAIIGCGYIGQRLLRHLTDVSLLTVRSALSFEAVKAAGYQATQVDFDQEIVRLPSLLNEDVIYLMPPNIRGEQDLRMRKFLDFCQHEGNPKSVVYISTTGVYGDCGGAWVDERQPVAPQADRAKRRYHAEQQLLEWSQETGNRVVILRVAGIYGRDKLPIARLQQKTPIIVESEAPYTNRIYAEDLVKLCLLALSKGQSGEVYHACDGVPGNMTDYFNQVADAAGLARPKQISRQQAELELSEGMLSYLAESRRLRNDKVKQDLGMVFDYPNLAAGLKHALSG